MAESKKRLLTVKEAAGLIDGLTEYRLRQMCLSGQMPCIKAGRKILIGEETLMRTIFGNNDIKENSEKFNNLAL